MIIIALFIVNTLIGADTAILDNLYNNTPLYVQKKAVIDIIRDSATYYPYLLKGNFSDTTYKKNVSYILLNIADTSAVPLLEKWLFDNNATVAANAIYSTIKFGPNNYLDTYLLIYYSREEKKIKKAIIAAITTQPNIRNFNKLKKIWEKENGEISEYLYKRLPRYVGKIDTSLIKNLVLEGLKKRNIYHKRGAIFFINNVGLKFHIVEKSEVEKYILQFIKKYKDRVILKESCAYIKNDLGSPFFKPLYKRMRRESDTFILRYILEPLVEYSRRYIKFNKKLKKATLPLLNYNNGYIQALALEIQCINSETTYALPLIEQILRSSYDYARVRALELLLNFLPDIKAITLLKAHIKTHDHQIIYILDNLAESEYAPLFYKEIAEIAATTQGRIQRESIKFFLTVYKKRKEEEIAVFLKDLYSHMKNKKLKESLKKILEEFKIPTD